MSIPYFGQEFTFPQPDGTYLRVRGFGNQEQAVFETLDGFTVTRDPVTGFYQYAALSSDGNDLVPTGYQAEKVNPRNLGLSKSIRANPVAATTSDAMTSGLAATKTRWQTRRETARMQKRAQLMAGPSDILAAPPQRETVGDFIGLCLLVDFPDVPGTISRQEVEAFCNRPNYNGFNNNGSVHDYFLANSRGRLRYTNIVAPYYTAQHPRSHYTDETQPYPLRTQELIREALESLRAQNFDFSPLTVDDAGFVYATNIFYAGPVVNGWSKGLWPHASRIPSFQLMPGKTVADYQITNMGNELTLGTFCHENGHMICDFPDLYDYRRDGVNSFGVGGFCLMCFGGNADGKNPTQINAYLKFNAGWADSVTNITAGLNASVRADANDFYVMRKNETEYFIIENRQKIGRDLALPGSGLAIWHIDEVGSNENQDMTPNSHYECSLVQADGEFDLERASDNQLGEAKDLFHGQGNPRFGDMTNPSSRWWNGTSSGLNITNISNNGPTITFLANG
jgi:M6 family metalloprotease-like protein